ncbi:MAG: hypothetical protein LRY55_13110, partial [Leadbetterella sp.]|nr:hypothetical protein [Leadbetterella sp.]
MVMLLLGIRFAAGQKTPSLLFKHLDYRNGLSDPNIQSLYSDHLGFLWIGTHNGLNRFDGQNCVSFGEDSSDHHYLEGNLVNRIMQDRKGDLLIGTQKGLSKYEYTTGTFRYFPHQEMEYYYAYPFHVDKQNQVWSNIAWYVTTLDTAFHFMTDKTNGRSYTGAFFKDRPGWFLTTASHRGLFIHYMNKDSLIASKGYFMDSVEVADAYIPSDSLAWVASDKGLIRLNPHT